MESYDPNKPMEWEILTRLDANTTFETLYEIVDPVNVVDKMHHLVEGIVEQGERKLEHWTDTVKEIDGLHRAEIRPIFDKIKLLCSSIPGGATGQEWDTPKPEQHILRAEPQRVNAEDKRKPFVRGQDQEWKFNCFPLALVNNPKAVSTDLDQADYVTHTYRENFYFTLPDLLGLFFTKLGPAPPGATFTAFYLPVLALYARWTTVLLANDIEALTAEQVADFEPSGFGFAKDAGLQGANKPRTPGKYHITWTNPEEGSGKRGIFSLGASLGGFHTQLATRKFGDLLRKARWDIFDRDTSLSRTTKVWVYPHPTSKQKGDQTKHMQWKWDTEEDSKTEKDIIVKGSIEKWKFGNCAETYPFMHMLAAADNVDRKNTMGITLESTGVALDPLVIDVCKTEYDFKHITKMETKSAGGGHSVSVRQFFEPPCQNCEFMLRHFGFDWASFQLRQHFGHPSKPAKRKEKIPV